ncbi:hypothetical protein OL548_14680 [Lysinibacillus sp. MHQ-1]|nr:hypothetical protein OL548_14680 [Lysinibacillus sp. MHQ-1]
MILQIIFILVVAILFGLIINFALIDGVLQAPFANAFMSFCENVLQLDYYAARQAYFVLFQQNKPLWLTIGFILLLLVIFLYGPISFYSLFSSN